MLTQPEITILYTFIWSLFAFVLPCNFLFCMFSEFFLLHQSLLNSSESSGEAAYIQVPFMQVKRGVPEANIFEDFSIIQWLVC